MLSILQRQNNIVSPWCHHNVPSSCYRRTNDSTTSSQHTTDIVTSTLRRNIMSLMSQRQQNVVSSCHQRPNVCTTSYQHATDVTMSGKCRINVPLTSQGQCNVESLCKRRHNVSTTSYQLVTDVMRSARRINTSLTSQPQHVIATLKTSCQRQNNVVLTCYRRHVNEWKKDLSVSASHRFSCYSVWYVHV